MLQIGILPFFEGTLITDCWASYWQFAAKHGLCNAHLLRELNALVEFFPKDKEWAQEAMDLLNEMNDARDKYIAENKTSFPKEERDKFRQRYLEIVEKGLALHPIDDSQKPRKNYRKGRARNLLDRMKKRMDNFLLFLDDFSVSFTNNDAERSLRSIAVRRNVAGAYDTLEGANCFTDIHSFVKSAAQHNIHPYQAVEAAVKGNPTALLFTEEEVTLYKEKYEEMEAKGIDLAEQMRKEIEKQEQEELQKLRDSYCSAAEKYDAALDRVVNLTGEIAALKESIRTRTRDLNLAEEELASLTSDSPGYKSAQKKVNNCQKKVKDAEEKLSKKRESLKKQRKTATKNGTPLSRFAAKCLMISWYHSRMTPATTQQHNPNK